MKKYCIVTRNLESKVGGIGIYGRNLIKKLRLKGFNLYISPQEKGTFPISYIKWLLFDIPLFLFKTDADAYHAIGIIEGILLPVLKPKKKKYVTIHDLIPLKYEGKGLRKMFERFLVRVGLFSARFYDKIFAVSHLTKVDIVRFGGIPEDKIKVVYQPIDEKFLKTPPSKGNNSTFNIGYISRMEEYKRHELLIKKFMEYKRPNARLYLAGTGPLFDRIKKLSEKDKRIVFLGFVPDEKIVEFYDMLGVYVHPSKYEGWGLPIVEALSRGKPVIVFEDAEIPNEIKKLCTLGRFSEFQTIIDRFEKDLKFRKKIAIITRRRCVYEGCCAS